MFLPTSIDSSQREEAGRTDDRSSTSSDRLPKTKRRDTSSQSGGPSQNSFRRRSARMRSTAVSFPKGVSVVLLVRSLLVLLAVLQDHTKTTQQGLGSWDRHADRSEPTGRAHAGSALVRWLVSPMFLRSTYSRPSTPRGRGRQRPFVIMAAAAFTVTGQPPPTTMTRTARRKLLPHQQGSKGSGAARGGPSSSLSLPREDRAWAAGRPGGISRIWLLASPPSSSSSDSTEPVDSQRKATAAAPRRVNYVRPSAAIERGSGFFVPGLEGGKARLVLGVVLMALCLIQWQQQKQQQSGELSLVIGSAYSILVVLQSGIEFARDAKQRERRSRSVEASGQSTTDDAFSCTWAKDGAVREASADSGCTQVDDYMDKVQWTASTFLSLTSSERMLLVHRDRVIFDAQLSQPTADSSLAAEDEATAAEACRSALKTLQQSSTGRVAIPSNHPTFQFVSSLQPNTAAATRTVILQRITPESYWVVTSSDLLAAFTPQDLTWLGQLATYVSRNG